MVHVSKNPMDLKTDRRVRNNLKTALFGSDLSGGGPFLDALLTKSEKTMLAKRLAIIVMLEQDFTYYRISKTLKVSVSTIMHLDELRSRGVYRSIQRKMKAARGKSFPDILEIILAAGMPSIGGPRHQKRLNALRGS